MIIIASLILSLAAIICAFVISSTLEDVIETYVEQRRLEDSNRTARAQRRS